MEKHGFVWYKGNDSVKGQLDIDGKIATVVKKHSAKGQWGKDKDESATVLGFMVDCSDVPESELITGYVEWWIINRFRRHSGILDTDRDKAIELWNGKTFDPTVDCLPPDESKRGPVDPVKVQTRLIKKATKEEQLEMIRLLQEALADSK